VRICSTARLAAGSDPCSAASAALQALSWFLQDTGIEDATFSQKS
jgi:hypothetical protein